MGSIAKFISTSVKATNASKFSRRAARIALRIERRFMGTCHSSISCNETNFHRIILESLKIGQGDARITKGCILEGELLVYDDSVRSDEPNANDILTLHRNKKFSPFIK